MKNDPTLNLSIEELKMLKSILSKCVPLKKVWVHGSRIKKKNSDRSDLDLVVFDASEDETIDLKNYFDESDFPPRVDILRWEDLPNTFRESIENHHVIIQ